MVTSSVHPPSLVVPSCHSPALIELLSLNAKYTLTLVEYIIDRVTEIVQASLDPDSRATRGRSASRHAGPQNLAQFMHRILYMSDTRVPVLLVALVYIARSRAYLHISQEKWAHERVFLGALMCAHKYVNDVTIKNHHWSICSGLFSAKDVGRIEREFLQVLDFELGFDESDILMHHAPIMRLLAPSARHPFCTQAGKEHPVPPSLDADSGDEECESDSASSWGSPSPPTTPPNAAIDTSGACIHVHPHSSLSISCSPVAYPRIATALPKSPAQTRRTSHHPLSVAMRLLHAFPVHHVDSDRADAVLVKGTAVPPTVCFSSSSSAASSAGSSLVSSPVLSSHHDILVTARYEKAFC